MNRIKIFFLIIGMIIVQTGFSQDDYQKRADKLYEHQAYSEAAGIYLAILQQNYDADINFKLAECYRQMNLMSDAEHWYGVLITQRSNDPVVLLHYANILKSNGNYKSAKVYFLKYAAYQEEGYYLASTCDWALANMNKVPGFLIDTLGFNSGNSEITPTFFKKGIIYSGGGNQGYNISTGMPFYDLYYAEKKNDSTWTNNSLGGDINSELHEASPYYDINSKLLYFTRNNHYKNRTIKSKSGEVKLEIYFSTYDEGKFSTPHPFSLNSKSYSIGQPAISPDGNVMIFASDRPGGAGGIDLYYAVKKNGAWSEPKNMGDMINTPGNEEYPFMSADGTLYFSSDYLPGFGGFDVFKSVRGDKFWTTPENLGMPLNSSSDDFGFIIRNGSGYFSSNRPGGKGSDDIYQITQLLPLTKIYVYDTNLKPIQKARVTLAESPKTNAVCETDATGMGDISSLTGSGISIRITKEGFLEKVISDIGNYRSSTGYLPVELQPLIGEHEQTPEKPVEEPAHNNN